MPFTGGGGPPDRDRRRRRRNRFRSRGGGPTPPPARRKRFGQPPQHQGKGPGGPGPGQGDQDQASATVATPGNEGTLGPEFDTGDMTGTDEIQDAVFSQGSGFAPQLHYGSNAVFEQQTADNVASASEAGP